MINAAPGIVIIERIEEEQEGIIVDIKKTRLFKGKVLSLGNPVQSDYSSSIIDPSKYCKINDLVYFLSYEGDYDWKVINHKNIHFVKAQDLRGIDK